KAGRAVGVLAATPPPGHDPAAEAEPAVPHVLDARGAPELELEFERVPAPEVADAASEEAGDFMPAGVDRAARGREHDAHVGAPEQPPDSPRNGKLEAGDRSAGPDDAGELGERRALVVDVAEQVGERERVEGLVREGQALGARLDELDIRQPLARDREHLRALVEADHSAALLPDQFGGDQAGSGGNVEGAVARPSLDARNQEPAPAGVLAERKQARVAVVRGPE